MSNSKTPRTLIQDHTESVSTEKNIHFTRKRTPQSTSTKSKSSMTLLPGGSATKKLQSLSVTEASEFTPRQLISAFLMTPNTTVPLTRQQSRIKEGMDMPPPTSSVKSKRRRRSSLGIPRVEEIVKKFTPRTGIEGLLTQAPEQTPVIGNKRKRKSRPSHSLPGVDAFLKDASFEPLQKSSVGSLPPSEIRHGTRKRRPIQIDIVHKAADVSTDEPDLSENVSDEREATPVETDEDVDMATRKTPKRRRSSVKERDKNASSVKGLSGKRKSQQTQVSDNEQLNVSTASAKKTKRIILSPYTKHVSHEEPDSPLQTHSAQTSPVVSREDKTIFFSPGNRPLSQRSEKESNNTDHYLSHLTDHPAETEAESPGRQVSLRRQAVMHATHKVTESDSRDSPTAGRSLYRGPSVGDVQVTTSVSRRTLNRTDVDVSQGEEDFDDVQTRSTRESFRNKSMFVDGAGSKNFDISFDSQKTLHPVRTSTPAVGQKSPRTRMKNSERQSARHPDEPVDDLVENRSPQRRISLQQFISNQKQSLVHENSSPQTSVSLHQTKSHQRQNSLHEASSPQRQNSLHQESSPRRQISLHQASSPKTRSSLRKASSAQRQSSYHQTSSPQGQISLHQASSPKTRSSLRKASSAQRRSSYHQTSSPQGQISLHEASSPKSRSSLRKASSAQRQILLRYEGSPRVVSPRKRKSLESVRHSMEFTDDTDDGEEISSVVESVIGQLASENDRVADVEKVVDEAVGEEMMDEDGVVEEDEEDVRDLGAAVDKQLAENLEVHHLNRLSKEKKKTKSKRKTADKSHLPAGVVKHLFTHFCRARVTKEAVEEVVRISGKFWKSMAADLDVYARHGQRKTVTDEDVELLMKRQGFVTEDKSLNTLIHQYLPLEVQEQVIPIARAGNRLELNKKYIT